MKHARTITLSVVAFVAGTLASAPANADGRPVYTRCDIVAVASRTLVDHLLPTRAGRIVTATTTRCRDGGRPVFTTELTVVKFADQPNPF